MNRQHARIGLLIISFILLNLSSTAAETLNFEDLNWAWLDLGPVPPDYGGLEWVKFTLICVDPLSCTGDKSGYVTGISGAVAVFNDSGLPAEFISKKPFKFVSAYLTSAWPGDLEITVDGYLDDKLVKSMLVTASSTASQLFTFNYEGVNRVVFIPNGETPLAGTSSDRTFFVMDNLSIIEDYTPSSTSITIDIKPGDGLNVVNPKSRGVIPVAVLTTDSFDATTVEPSTAWFGVTGSEAPELKAAIEDVNGDGRPDMLLFFATRQTGIECGVRVAVLRAQTTGGTALEGSDSVRTVPCK